MEKRTVAIIAVVLTAVISGSTVYALTRFLMPPPRLIRVAWADSDVFPTNNGVILKRAQELFLDEKGIVLERFGMHGSADAIKMLEAGKVQFANVLTGHFFKARERGIDIKLIAASVSGLPFFFVTPNSIRSAEDLKGKIIAHHGWGGMSWVVMMAVLDYHGISPDEVDIRVIPGSETRRAALLAGKIDATVVDVPNTIYLVDTGDYYVFGDLTDRYPDVMGNSFVAKSDWIEDNKDLLVDIFSAYFQTLKLFREDIDEYLDVMERLAPEYERELARKSWEVQEEFYRVDGGVSPEIYERTVDVFVDLLNVTESAPNYTDAVDDSIVKQAAIF